ncbi:MAG: two-component system response regulator [Gemmatimonadetes bacterium]|nr:two-component system response regulator [Gemmatimonadota bacterium]
MQIHQPSEGERGPDGGILIVDDSGYLRAKLRRVLEKFGYQVAGEAEDGGAAVKMFQELRPSLVTMDVVMPHMDGVQAVREIRQVDPQAKVVMVTSLGHQEKVLECLRAGAVNFVVKPFTEHQLMRVVRRVLRD